MIRHKVMDFVSVWALPQKFGSPDPLPPSAAVPLKKGDSKAMCVNEASREAAGGRVSRTFEARPSVGA